MAVSDDSTEKFFQTAAADNDQVLEFCKKNLTLEFQEQ